MGSHLFHYVIRGFKLVVDLRGTVGNQEQASDGQNRIVSAKRKAAQGKQGCGKVDHVGDTKKKGHPEDPGQAGNGCASLLV